MNKTNINKNGDCEVKVELQMKGKNEAICSIQIKNTSNNTLYFFNRLYYNTTDGGLIKNSKDILYSFVNHEGILVLSKSIMPVPSDMQVEKEVVPCCTKILPNEMFEEQLNLVLPVEQHHPYEDPEELNNAIYKSKFQFGYFAGHGTTETMEKKIKSESGEEVIFFDPFDINYQKIIEVGMFNSIPVKSK